MKFSLAVTSPLLLLSTTTGVTAFAPSQRHHRTSPLSILSSTPANNNGPLSPVTPIQKKVLTAADVISKSSSAGDPAGPGNEEAPKSFSLEIYDDFQSALLLLEKRAKGPAAGSLSLEEVTNFEVETNRIVKEMKEYLADSKGCGERIRLGYEASAAGVEGVVVETKAAVVSVPPPAAAAAASVPHTPPAAQTRIADIPAPSLTSFATTATTINEPSTLPNVPPNVPPEDDEDKEGYGLAVGGMARGTTNTYALEGMDEMSPEEYRDNLQKSISARQAKRRKDSLTERGKIGNMNSSGYLDALSGGAGLGAPGVVRPAVVGGGQGKKKYAVPPQPPAAQISTSADIPAPSLTSFATAASDNSEVSIPNIPPSVDEDEEDYGLALGGMARGTTNTYALEGMDEMSPEEYRDNLQKSISARQAKRRKDSLTERGKIGNMNSSGYLDVLSGGAGLGAPGVVKAAVVGGGQGKKKYAVPPQPPAAQISTSADIPAPTLTSFATTATGNSEASLPNVPPKDAEDEEFTGGYGLARGTTNTYALDGMDEMSPEEYRDNLQKSISARQAKRRKDSLTERGKIGNMNSSGYLDALSGGAGLGAPGVVKASVVGGKKNEGQEQG